MIIRRWPKRPSSAFSPAAWTCPACARRSLPNQINPQQPPSQRRTLLTAPQISFDDTFARRGIENLLSADAYTKAWREYQTQLLTNLNEQIAGTPLANLQAKDIALQTARDPLRASIFNYASMAHNNHLFFSAFSPAPQALSDAKHAPLRAALEESFGSIETLRITMLDMAAAMFGPGFVWLVLVRNTGVPSSYGHALGVAGSNLSFRLLATYLAGTPYPEAGWRAQTSPTMTSSPNSPSSSPYSGMQPANSPGAFGTFSRSGRDAANMPPGGTSVLPVLCVNTWEHVWMWDYGVGGKRRYLEDWWEVVDWNPVMSRVQLQMGGSMATARRGFERSPF